MGRWLARWLPCTLLKRGKSLSELRTHSPSDTVPIIHQQKGKPMSRKDYRAFAKLLRQLIYDGGDHEGRIDTLINGMSDIFAADNPRFDAERFRNAVLLDSPNDAPLY